MKPADEMRVDVELVSVEELVEHHALGWQAMITVVLVILVAELVYSHHFSPECLIHVLLVPLSETRPSF